MSSAIFTFLLLFLFGTGKSANPDDSLPVYLRGLNWNRVQEHLKEDLRLGDAVIPLNYGIDLDVNVRGHAGAAKSDFNGTVTIYLNITKRVDKIEVHSNGLIIEKARLINRVIMSTPAGVNRITSNSERETITIHANRTIQPDEEFMLQIIYRGVAKMDEYGLYENWDPKFNKSLDSNGPFILASNNFPTGARFWFPCFDEPNKKATFELEVNHPSGLNVYSNTELKRTSAVSEGRTLSVFKKTRDLATYQVALSVNHLASQTLDVKGFGKVRLISTNNSCNYWRWYPRSWLNYGWLEDLNDIPALVKHNLKVLRNFSFGDIKEDKLDIIVLEGTQTNRIHPGLATIGRTNLWGTDKMQDLSDLAQLRIGNQMTVRNSNEMWLNHMFSHFSANETSSGSVRNIMNYMVLASSLHERPLRDDIIHSTTTKQYLSSKNELPSLKERASHILKLLTRFCPSSTQSLKNYTLQHIGKFTDIDEFIETATKSCDESKIVQEFLQDFIDQPGKAFLSVKRRDEHVTIEQTRYHETYFDNKLRDTKTRYTIPIFFSIDGNSGMKVFRKNETSITIQVPQTSLFLIDHNYELVYFAFYENIILPQRNITEEERKSIVYALQKSMASAVNIGFAKYKQIHDQLKFYVYKNVFGAYDYHDTDIKIRILAYPSKGRDDYSENSKYYKKFVYYECEEWEEYPGATWVNLFNDGTKYWVDPTDKDNTKIVTRIQCLKEWHNSTQYQRFLEEHFLGENTVIRPELTPRLITRTFGSYQWTDIHRFFFRNAANFTNHRFNLLADTVLNRHFAEVFDSDPFPTAEKSDDYLQELREFVIQNPRRAASMSTDIKMRLEREFVRRELPKWHSVDGERVPAESYDDIREGEARG